MRGLKSFGLSIAKLKFLFSLSIFASVLLCIIGGITSATSAQSDAEASSTRSSLTVSPKKLTFGQLAPLEASAPETVTIHNQNSIAVNISSIESVNPQFAPSLNCMGSIQGGSDCVLSLIFTPSSDGKKSGKVRIGYSAGHQTLIVKVLGYGKGAPMPTPTPTATPSGGPTATPTPTPTRTATPTPAPTPGSCPSPGAGACPSSGPPSISSLLPSSVVAGGPGVGLAVCGCNLTASTAVEWNSVARTTSFVSSNQVNASIPAADVADVGVDQVTVAANAQVSAPETFFVGSTGGAGYAALEIDQQSNGIVYDPVNQVIYLSVPGGAPTNGNTISVIGLASGTITSSVFAGSDPDAIAISDDSQFLYAGIDGAALVQRFMLPDLVADISYGLGREAFFGPYFALDLQVAPGAPHTTAVTLGNFSVSPQAEGGIVIFDDSTPRPTISPGWSSSTNLYNSLQWGSDATALYAANYEDTAWDFYALAVDSFGVVQTHDYQNSFSRFDFEIHFDPGTGLIYSDEGHVIDPLTGKPVAKFSILNGVMVPDSTLNRAFFINQSAGSATIYAFDLKKFSLIGSIFIPNVPAKPNRIIRWGNNGLAFNTAGGPVYLIGGKFVH
ncbi:MAG TPA: hypothetical protein VEO55_05985 [Candidatus Dormibacteraeota bacterium]|nr:hypothetical protein [Candidatus Dormibacteraeota bacterium]